MLPITAVSITFEHIQWSRRFVDHICLVPEMFLLRTSLTIESSGESTRRRHTDYGYGETVLGAAG